MPRSDRPILGETFSKPASRAANALIETLKRRIVIIVGAMGTIIQTQKPAAGDAECFDL